MGESQSMAARPVDSLMACTGADPQEILRFLQNLVQQMPAIREHEDDGGAPIADTADAILQQLARPCWRSLRDYFAVTGALAAYEAIPYLPLPREGERT